MVILWILFSYACITYNLDIKSKESVKIVVI